MIKILEQTSNVLILQQKPGLGALIAMAIFSAILIYAVYIGSGIASAIIMFLFALVIIGSWFVVSTSFAPKTWKVERNQKLLIIQSGRATKTYSIDQAQLVRTVFDRDDEGESYYFIEFQLTPPNQPLRINIGVGLLTPKEQEFLVKSISSFLGIQKG
jgi:hypothetical protein